MRDNEPTYGNGKVCYLVMPALDISASSSFYQNVFDWKIRRRGDGSVAFDDGVNQVSGTWVLGRKTISNGGILIHIMVDDAETTLKKIVAHGGKIVEPIGKDYPEITATFSDPGGNVLGIYQQPS